jgi:hypothetical protein
MATMENLLDAFITENGLDEDIKDALIDVVNGCFGVYVGHMSKEWLANPVKEKNSTSKSKKEKLDDPTEATTIDDLRNCTTLTLNEYCKNNKLKVGGNKKEISGRVWRHIQGDSSDEDVSSRSKPKKEKVVKETHSCFACNAKGAPCGIAATEEHSGKWFCFHHIDDAAEIIAAKAPVEPAPKKKSKKTESKPKKAKSKKSSDEDSDELVSE